MKPTDTTDTADTADTAASDIPEGGWIDHLPGVVRPYFRLARLDRPIGTWLLLFPCWWSVVLASPGLAPAGRLMELAALFAAGAIVMRGAGCTFNDIVDRDLDAKVARTRMRPIPSGAVSVRAAVMFLVLELMIGLGILAMFNNFTIALGIASLALIFTYPFMKRITYWPQAWLGLTFNWGALLGFAAVTGTLGPEAVALYTAGFFWTLGYDTIYAHQDRADDLLVGIKSLALKFGANTLPWLMGFFTAAGALMFAAGIMAGLGWAYYLLLALAFAQLLWQALRVDIDDPHDCLAKFRSNRLFGWLVLAALAAGQINLDAALP
ncbi:MAG: 4-hydroxybenzoate octaprenyltransferase [Alphaproteobacteria bacterium]|nr:4-hydroxybenzoate octaprenyltransferase [Alphaproteobacteria bacterium]